MEHLLKKNGKEGKVMVDSCGLYEHFLGATPDSRMQAEAKRKGIHLHHQAKLFEPVFFEVYTAIFGVTTEITGHLRFSAKDEKEKEKIHLVTDFSQKFKGHDILDPYYHDNSAFEKTWEMIEDSCKGIYEHLVKNEH